jgi:hypothetical protein
MKTKLTIELVPRGQWGSNLRSELKRSEWDKLRKECYSLAGYKCEICEGKGRRWPVEAHEIWDYDENTKTQRLLGLIALCPPCHEVKHIGRANATGNGPRAERQLMKVNGWTESDAAHYIDDAFEVWMRRSQENWTLDISWVTKELEKKDEWV